MNTTQGNATPSPLGDNFDRVRRSLNGLPDVVAAGPSTIETFTPVVELAETWIITTVRQAERGDVIFLQVIGGNGGQRFVLPPAVADAIARQRDTLATKNRRKGARRAVETKRAKGIDPAAALLAARAASRHEAFAAEITKPPVRRARRTRKARS